MTPAVMSPADELARADASADANGTESEDAARAVLTGHETRGTARSAGGWAKDRSFVCFVGAKHRGTSGNAGRCRRRSEHVAAKELGCEVLRDFGSAGFLAAAPGARTHECEDTGMLTVFVGELENLEEMARNVDLPADANPAHVVTQMKATFGTHFLDELRGRWAFAMVHPQREAVFAAVDSASSHTVYRGRGCEGGVVILHAAEDSDFDPFKCDELDVFELKKIPPASFISGNKHINPHRYTQVTSDDDLYGAYETFEDVGYLADFSKDLKATLT